MYKLTYLAVLLALACAVYAGALESFTYQDQGDMMGDTNAIFYGQFGTIKNVVNPVVMEIVYPTVNYNANACFSSGSLQISGVNLEATCPEGGFGVISNENFSSTAKKVAMAEEEEGAMHQLKFARTQGSRFVGNRMAMAVEGDDDESTVSQAEETVDAEVYVGSTGQFVVTIPGYNGTFTVSLSGMRCEDPDEFPIGTDAASPCLPITNVVNLEAETNNVTKSITLGARESAYFLLQVPQTNFLNITVPSVFTASLQSGTIPSDNYTLPAVVASSDGYFTTISIDTPGYFSGYESLYLRVENTINTELIGKVTISKVDCPTAGMIGPGCLVQDIQSTNATGAEIYLLDGIVLENSNNGTSVEFDLSESDLQYAYFVLPKSNQPSNTTFTKLADDEQQHFVRVSFANNVIDALGGQTVGPTVYAKADGYPSAESYDLRVAGALVNQVLVPVTSDPVDWYFAVETPADFSAWAGTNCANECDNEEHGYCMCNNAICWNTTETADPDVTQLYTLPTSTKDSAGACHCSDDNYSQSFDCSSKTNNNSTLYIVLLAVGGAIVLAVAIGVPIYCYFQNRKRARYDRV